MLNLQRVNKFNPPVGSMKILLLEDDAMQRRLIKKMLHAYDCEFFEAETPSEAWKHTESRNIDLAIIDLCLPGEEGDGIQFVSRLRDNAKYKRLPILMISGLPNRTAVELAQTLNCIKFLTKPLNEERLTETLRNTGSLRMSAFQHKVEVEEDAADGPVVPRTAFHVPGDVVLVDRNPDRVASFRALLKNTEWSLEVVPHYTEVTTRLHEKPADMVFININQQEATVDAINVCVQLQDDEALAGTKIVALAYKNNPDALLLAKDAGIVEFILDRVTSEKLVNAGQFLLEECFAQQEQVASKH